MVSDRVCSEQGPEPNRRRYDVAVECVTAVRVRWGRTMALATAIAMTAACWTPRARHVGTEGHANQLSTADRAIEPKPWQTRHEHRRLEIVDPGRWIDRPAGVAELRVRCLDVRTEVWCERGDCTERSIESPIECEVTRLAVRSPWGATATSALDSSGVAIFFLDDVPDDAAPPAAALGWTVDGPDGQLAWRDFASLPSDDVPEVPDASTEVAVEPTYRRRSYFPAMWATDLTILGIVFAFLVSDPSWDATDRTIGVGAVIAYVAAGATHHAFHRDWGRAGVSVVIRLLSALPGISLATMVYRQSQPENAGEDGPASAILAVPLTVVTVITALVIDWTRAYVDVPVDVRLSVTGTA